MKTPKAVKDYCAEFDETEDGLRQYVRDQKRYFDSIPQRPTRILSAGLPSK